MKNTLFTLSLCLLAILTSSAQHEITLQSGVRLPKDTATARLLRRDLAFLLEDLQREKPIGNQVNPAQRAATQLLLDELKELPKSSKAGEPTYTPYISNIINLGNQYLIQLLYQGAGTDKPVTRAAVTLLADKAGDHFVFSSPLQRRTASWQIHEEGTFRFHHRDPLNKKHLKEFIKRANGYDQKLKVKGTTTFYCAEDMPELLYLIGLDYDADYNGRSQSVFGATTDGNKVVVLGNHNTHFDAYDTHDLWHDRLSMVIDRSLVNRPVDEGIAYAYGGSWGLTWAEIYAEFMTQVAGKSDVDWTRVKEQPVYFKTKGFNNSADNIVAALWVNEIEKKYGFDAVWKLLTCGPVEPGHANFFKTLESITGVRKEDYNTKVWELVRNGAK
ncbi:MAG: hypothetical protein K1X47_16375 [Cyclobacteriaceae bacterium]|nr:hypothetical protein [Cyclobacteriaceae bacterium]